MSEKPFIDRRSQDEVDAGLATHILFWYDREPSGKKRRRCNGIAITTTGVLLVARATCSKKDQFIKVDGRTKVTGRLVGRAKEHSWAVQLVPEDWNGEGAAKAYAELFGDDETGLGRAYNVGNIWRRYTLLAAAS